jgi:inhibitor of growth protein 3
MAAQEDCASVLEQFVHDVANLPAEISHMMEEIQAKDSEIQKYQSSINSKDANLQKHIKMNGVLQAHPKEAEYSEQVKKNYDLIAALQDQKVTLSERACNILDRQLKRLDTKIRELATDGQISADGLPSIFNRKPDKAFMDVTQNMPLQNASVSALNANAHRVNSQAAAAGITVQPRQNPQLAVSGTTPQRASAPATPAAIQAQRQREREQSVGADSKRRKLGNPLAGANLPAQPSSLRQSSLGPGTPKAGTPTGTAGSRAGSVPRTTAAPQTAAINTKKSALSNKPLSNQQVNKLKNKHTKHARLSSAGRKKAQSPSVRGARAGTAASEDDSVLSSADASETDASQSRSRRGQKKKQAVKQEVDVDMEENDGGEEELDEEDNSLYCYCQKQSYGNMVACENEDCKYQWFHVDCLNLKKMPAEDEDWYCPDCRVKQEIIDRMRLKKPAGRK